MTPAAGGLAGYKSAPPHYVSCADRISEPILATVRYTPTQQLQWQNRRSFQFCQPEEQAHTKRIRA